MRADKKKAPRFPLGPFSNVRTVKLWLVLTDRSTSISGFERLLIVAGEADRTARVRNAKEGGVGCVWVMA